MKNKGFTLVELLGVVIILSILVTLVFPSVVNFIKNSNSKKEKLINDLIIVAAESYIKDNNDNLYLTSAGKHCVSINTLVEMQYLNNFDDISKYQKENKSIRVTYDNGYKYEIVDSNSCTVCKLLEGQQNQVGSKYECEVKAGTKYNFYVLSHESNGTTNLIMDRNICEDGSLATEDNLCTVAWISPADYYEDNGDVIPDDVLHDGGPCEYEGYCSFNDKGPVTAMNYLNNATSDWSNISNLNLTYEDEGNAFGSIEISGKARLPYHREVNAVGCKDYSFFSCPIWMVDYLHDAGIINDITYQETPIENIAGYWILSSSANWSYNSWTMEFDGNVHDFYVDDAFLYGVRPVINIKLDSDVEENIPEPKSFREDSWETIAANVKAGNLSKYKVGDTKEITLTSDDTKIAGTYTVRIVNTSTPSECAIEGFSQTACGFVIEFVDIISEHGMNSSDTNAGGWEASEMRSYVNNEIYNAFPEELRKLIIDTYVVSGHEPRKTENYKTTDKIYLLSTKEVWEDGEYRLIEDDTAREETRQLDYYKQKGVTTDSYSDAIKDVKYWWLRSAVSYNTYYFYFVNGNGDWSNIFATSTYGVAVAFRL